MEGTYTYHWPSVDRYPLTGRSTVSYCKVHAYKTTDKLTTPKWTECVHQMEHLAKYVRSTSVQPPRISHVTQTPSLPGRAGALGRTVPTEGTEAPWSWGAGRIPNATPPRLTPRPAPPGHTAPASAAPVSAPARIEFSTRRRGSGRPEVLLGIPAPTPAAKAQPPLVLVPRGSHVASMIDPNKKC